MSYIDCFNHSYAGNFAGLPVYHPLQDIDPEGKDEFSATTKNLVLGGGSGEHPGMIVKDLDYCVWKYLECLADIANKECYEIKFYTDYLDALPNQQFNEEGVYGNLHFAHWGLERISRFTQEVEKEFEDSVKYFTNKDNFKNTSTEEKIHIMLGEFIFFSAKELISDNLREYIDNNIHLLEESKIDLSAPFAAVKVLPKGYPGYSGRCLIIDDQGNEKVQWGLRYDEEYSIDRILNDPNRMDRSRKLRM